MLRPFQQMCNSKKVQAEILVLEDQDTPKAILEYISNKRMTQLVMGSSHRLITRKLKGRDVPASIAMKTKKFCSVFVISKGKLDTVYPSNTSLLDSSSSSSENTPRSRGNSVLELSETTTDDVNGNQSFESRRKNFEEALVSKMGKTSFFSGNSPDIENKVGRLKIELQHTREKGRGVVHAIEEPDIENKVERLKIDLPHTRENGRGVVNAFEEAKGLNAQQTEELGKLEETEDAFKSADKKCREYSIEQIQFATGSFSESLKVGEGRYGPVYKGNLDHTTVAIKILRTDAARGRNEFQREIEVLSRIHHPNMILLLGACPERGCLVYEYMENGSLEDWLFESGARDSIPWFIRFRIASEIASALHFLHSAKPEPIVHRDLKPDNILLDHNFVSKIGDVGLARLVPPTVSYAVTEYRNTVLHGTLCYMDPEYTRTGTLRTTSDLYALGIILLQLLTGKPPVAIIEKVQKAMKKGLFREILDKTAGEWPLETIEFAKLALKCTELRGRDRPDLGSVILPIVRRFRDLGDAHAQGSTS